MKQTHIQTEVYKKELKMLATKFKRTVVRQMKAQMNWIYIIKFILIISGILRLFGSRVKEIMELEDVAKNMNDEEDFYKYP
jgi:hypothetical protein